MTDSTELTGMARRRRRWDSSFGVGSLLSLMLPYALCFAVAGILMTIGWVYFDLPLGPHATVEYTPPGELLEARP